jgi:hypothetical protein
VAKKVRRSYTVFPNPNSRLARRVRRERQLTIEHVRTRAFDPVLVEAAERLPASQTWKPQKARGCDSPALRKELQELVDEVVEILEAAPARPGPQLPARPGYVPPRCQRCGELLPRSPVKAPSRWVSVKHSLQERLALHAECVARLLLETRWACERDRDSVEASWIPVGPPVKIRGRSRQPMIPGPVELRARVKSALEGLRLAQKSWDRLKSSQTMGTIARASLALFGARLKLETARQEQHTLLSGLPDPPTKHQENTRHWRIMGILHEMHGDYGIPDATISKLLGVARLPTLSPRNIKRIRLSFRRP